MRRLFSVAIFLLLLAAVHYFFFDNNPSGEAINSVPVSGDAGKLSLESGENVISQEKSNRQVYEAEAISLPLPESAPTTSVKHSIPIAEIRQGCFRQDCIPSIDSPTFISVREAEKLITTESIGIALNYKGIDRFYPFPMLETHELVNDIVAGDPLLISYCPLCGTGIVFDRTLNGQVEEFGVSGMLWQSNLLMYNRAANQSERNLWSQVLGEAVVGKRTGEKLSIIPSNIMRFGDWATAHPDSQVLGGQPADPYKGRYTNVAQRFAPNFDFQNATIAADTYVYGIEVNNMFKAYEREKLPLGETTDTVGGEVVTVINDNAGVRFSDNSGTIISDVEGFWFSWIAAHPETLLWDN